MMELPKRHATSLEGQPARTHVDAADTPPKKLPAGPRPPSGLQSTGTTSGAGSSVG